MESVGSKAKALSVFSYVAGAASIVGLFLSGIGLFSEPIHGSVYLGSQCLITLSLIGALTYVLVLRERALADAKQHAELLEVLRKQMKKLEGFGNGYEYLHKIFHELRSAFMKLSDVTKPIAERSGQADVLFTQFIHRAVDNLQKVFALTADPQCRVCVKQLRDDAKSVETICRDSGSEGQNEPEIAKIEENTDFHNIMRKIRGYERYFYCNDLLALGDLYENSTPNWDERYKSTIVWPIRGPLPNRNYDVAGFLCVDSLKTDVFDEKKSVQVGAAVADILYILLDCVAKLKKEKGEPQ